MHKQVTCKKRRRPPQQLADALPPPATRTADGARARGTSRRLVCHNRGRCRCRPRLIHCRPLCKTPPPTFAARACFTCMFPPTMPCRVNCCFREQFYRAVLRQIQHVPSRSAELAHGGVLNRTMSRNVDCFVGFLSAYPTNPTLSHLPRRPSYAPLAPSTTISHHIKRYTSRHRFPWHLSTSYPIFPHLTPCLHLSRITRLPSRPLTPSLPFRTPPLFPFFPIPHHLPSTTFHLPSPHFFAPRSPHLHLPLSVFNLSTCPVAPLLPALHQAYPPPMTPPPLVLK